MIGTTTDTIVRPRPGAVSVNGSVAVMSDQPMTIDDDYSGELTNTSPPQRRTLSNATVTKMSVGPMDNNAYVIVCSNTGQSLLIDAANDADRIEAVLDALAPSLSSIVTTHQHADHWQALAQVAADTSAPSSAHRLDAEPLPVTPTRLLDDADTISVGDLTLDVIHLVGHTPGSIALALTDPADDVVHLFTGDSLFPGGVGKTTSPEDFASLISDVTEKIFDRYADSTVVYPGHGKDTTLGAERPSLAEWTTRGW